MGEPITLYIWLGVNWYRVNLREANIKYTCLLVSPDKSKNTKQVSCTNTQNIQCSLIISIMLNGDHNIFTSGK